MNRIYSSDIFKLYTDIYYLADSRYNFINFKMLYLLSKREQKHSPPTIQFTRNMNKFQHKNVITLNLKIYSFVYVFVIYVLTICRKNIFLKLKSHSVICQQFKIQSVLLSVPNEFTKREMCNKSF